jgi:hypothetical protein
MIGRKYVVPMLGVAVSAAQDLFMIAPATNKPCIVYGLTLDNVGGTADMGDAQEEGLSLSIARGYATVGSAGSSVTPSKVESSTVSAAGFTARINDTTVAVVGGGTVEQLPPLGWNPRIGLREFWPEEACVGVSAAETRLVVRLVNAPNDSFTVNGCLYVCELG